MRSYFSLPDDKAVFNPSLQTRISCRASHVISDTRQFAVSVAFTLLAVLVQTGDVFGAVEDELTHEYPPQLVREQAAQGKFLSVQVAKQPRSFTYFQDVVTNTLAKGEAVFLVGIVVEAQEGHSLSDEAGARVGALKDVLVNALIGDRAKGQPGWAELYGVRIYGVLPIFYRPGAVLRLRRDGEMVEVPVDIGSIVVAINDHGYAYDEEGKLLTNAADLRAHIERALDDDRHLITSAQYLARLNAQIAALDRRIVALDAGIEEDDVSLARIWVEIIEGLLLLAALDLDDWTVVTPENREDRTKVETYFIEHGLPIDSNWDQTVMYATLEPHMIEILRQGCEYDDFESCSHLGFRYLEGDKVPQDRDQAARLMRKSCEGGFQIACGHLRQYFGEGTP